MKQKIKVSSEHSRLIQILEMINAALGLAGFYALAACFSAPDAGRVWFFTLYGVFLLVPIGVSFAMIRLVRRLFLYGLAAVAVTALMTLGAYGYGRVIPYGQLICPPITLLCCMTIFIVRVRAAVEQRQMQNDFAATHDGEENVFMEKWEVPTFLTRVKYTSWITNAICYIIVCFLHKSAAVFPLFSLLFMNIIVYFMHAYLENFEQYIRDNSRVANMPISMMKRVHRMIFGLAAALLLAFMLPALIYGKEPMDGFLQRLPKREITAVQEFVPEAVTEEAMGGMDMDMEAMLGETKEMPEWVKKLLDMIAYGMGVGVAFAGGWLLISKLREAGREYGTEEKDEVLFLDDVAEDAEQALYQGRKKEQGFFSTNAQIRRRYRKAIKKGTKGLPEQWASPTELEEAASMEAGTRLHTIYEKARYSQSGCDKEDLESLKS